MIHHDQMSRRSRLAVFSFIAFALAASPGNAHILPGTGGLAAGLMHPLSGLDHILAMAAIGVWAGQNATESPLFRWLPLGFILGMIAGAGLGIAGFPLPFVEQGIIGSVVLLGAIIALGRRAPFPAALALTALFGGFHGYAHGQELPAASNALLYGLGFVLTTAALHALGYATARCAMRLSGAGLMRWSGLGIALAGLALAST